jgi:hypothetical protein
MTPHPYASVIKAAADGATVQFKTKENGAIWADWRHDHFFPTFSGQYEWRVKPQTLRYRVAKMRHGNPVLSVSFSKEDADATQKHPYFIEWLHDLQEVEV